MMALDRLTPAIGEVARAIGPARDPWWIIGSAALVLHGLDPGPVGDIDLLTSTRDAATLLARRGIMPSPGVPDDRFRSAVFGRWTAATVAVEVMGGFELREQAGCGWQPVRLTTREAVSVGNATTFVPSRVELADLLRRFGRAKDLARAALLDHAPSATIPRSAGPNAYGNSSDSQ